MEKTLSEILLGHDTQALMTPQVEWTPEQQLLIDQLTAESNRIAATQSHG